MDNMTSTPVQFLAVLTVLAGLVGYIIKLVLPRLLKKIDEKDNFIKMITEKFTDVQNHKTTEMTKALLELKNTIHTNNVINERLISFLKNGHDKSK